MHHLMTHLLMASIIITADVGVNERNIWLLEGSAEFVGFLLRELFCGFLRLHELQKLQRFEVKDDQNSEDHTYKDSD
jgi:hypothetical protein